MFLLNWFLSIFGCAHQRYTWPLTTDQGTHAACLDCGKKFPYKFKGLGGLPARTRRPRITAPRVLMLQTPGKAFVAIGEDRQSNIFVDLEVR